MVKKLSILLLSFALLLNVSLIAESSKEKIEQLSKEIKQALLDKKLTKNMEQAYTSELRKLFVKEYQESEIGINCIEIMLIFKEINLSLRNECIKITDEEFEKSEKSVGVALFKKNNEEALEYLLREACCLNTAATIFLRIIYLNKVEKFEKYNKKILELIKQLKDEGLPRYQLYYGEIIFNGFGVQKDLNEGEKYLNLSKLPEAYNLLADYYYKINDRKKLEKYLRKGVEINDLVSIYNLGVFEQTEKKYKESVKLFEKVLSIDPNYYEAKLELGRMYIEGWGVTKDLKKGFNYINEVSNKAKDPMLRAVAHANLGTFYLQGLGVKKSISDAKKHFEISKSLGFEQADYYLDNLVNYHKE